MTVPWNTPSSGSILEIGIVFHMSRTFNIANLQFKWLQEFLDIHFLETGIIRGRDHQAQHIFYLPETPQTPFLNCPIDLLTHLVWKGSRFGGHVMRNLLVSIRWLWTHIYAHFVLVLPWFSILDTSNTRLGLKRLQTSGYVLSPHLTSQAPALTSNVPSTQARTSAAHTILPPAITSGASDGTDGWQCDPWFKT